ncbi:MAG: hypothetical protein KFF74_00985 [Candidatus Nanosynbacter sp.]|nr:hypothetical protein [Candidatus Nanosynbacter sp.]
MRYLILILLNVPIILAALINIITQYKLRKVSPARFRHQLIIWLVIMVSLMGSFPIYNISLGHPPLDSSELSLFDILQTTTIIFLFYITNNQRQRIDQNERRLRDLHQELSIRLSVRR